MQGLRGSCYFRRAQMVPVLLHHHSYSGMLWHCVWALQQLYWLVTIHRFVENTLNSCAGVVASASLMWLSRIRVYTARLEVGYFLPLSLLLLLFLLSILWVSVDANCQAREQSAGSG